MKTRTAAFDIAWGNRRVRKAVFEITYKRRYWNGSAYVLEAVAKTIPRREIQRISGLSWRLDTPLQNVIRSSNISIVLLDKFYKWLPANTTSGIWRADATATLGYEPVGSQFTVKYGYVLADDTEEMLSVFTGRIADDLQFDSKSGIVTIALVALSDSKLETADAQQVGTFIDDQATSPATGDGSNATFSTQKKSLWRVRTGTVRVAAVAKVQGTDFTLDKLNDGFQNADIVFETAAIPTAGQAVLYDGDQWHRGKSIGELVGLLCDQAGIVSADRMIEEPVFDAVDQSQPFDSQAQWESAAVKTNISTNSNPGAIRRKWWKIDDFTDGDLTADPVWSTSAGAGATFGVVSNKLRVTASQAGGTSARGSTPFTRPTGKWRFKATHNEGATGLASAIIFFATGAKTGYCIILATDSNAALGASLAKTFGGSLFTSPVTLLNIGTISTAAHDWVITRSSAGLLTVYMDGVSKGSITDLTFAIPTDFEVASETAGSGSLTCDVDDIYYSTDANTGDDDFTDAAAVWRTAEIDMLAAPSAWLPLDYIKNLNDGTVTIKTDVASVSGGPYDGEVEVDGTFTPTSALKRFVKLAIYITPSVGTPFTTPEIEKATLRWRSQTLFVTSADFTALTCKEAIAELATMGGCEFYTKGDGTFVFRNKPVSGTEDLILNQKNAIAEVLDYSSGYRDVRNVAQVRYGKPGVDGYYFREWKASDSSEASPTTAEKFGSKVIDLGIERFLFANNANVADAISQKLFVQNYRPKRKLRVRCRIIPHLDVSDKLKISFHDSPLIEQTIYGDPFQKGFPPIGPNQKTLARNIQMKVLGHSMDVMKSESVLDLEEVLS